MLEWLKDILGESYTEDIDKKISTEIGKGFVPKADFNTVNETKKTLEGELATANTKIAEFADMDVDTIKQEAADWKIKAESAEKSAAEKIKAMEFDTYFAGLVAKNKGRDVAVIKALVGDERYKELADSKNRDSDANALFEELSKNSAYAFESAVPVSPPYAAGTGTGAPAGAPEKTYKDELRDRLFGEEK